MGNKNPNGNILTDHNGNYNSLDGGAHEHIFEKVKERYAVGYKDKSNILSKERIERLAPSFLSRLQAFTGKTGNRPIDIITRYGLELGDTQVEQFVAWVNA